jgi:hypothetical protein
MIHHVATLGMVGYAIFPFAQDLKKPGTVREFFPSGASAKAQEIHGEFVVFKGSTARVIGPQGWTSYRGLREQLVLEKKLVPCDSPEFYVFAENVALSSPTAGAVIVNAGNVSGRIGSWRVEGTSKTYQDWHEGKLAKAGAAPAEVE